MARRTMAGLLLLAAMAVPLWQVHVMDGTPWWPLQRNDLISRWAGVRYALEGQNPYSPKITRAIEAYANHDRHEQFVYPATLVTEMAPLAWMSWKALRLTFLLTMIPLLALSFWLSLRLLHLDLSWSATAAAVWLGLCSWPVIWALRLQQPTVAIAVEILLSCVLLSRGRGVGAGILLALATVKPQLVVPLLLWIAVRAWSRREWKVLISFGAAVLILLGATERLMPGWFPEWMDWMRQLGPQYGQLPLQEIFGRWAGLAGTVVLLGWGAARLWRMRKCEGDSAEFGMSVALVLGMTVCVNDPGLPLIYNQILLFPACVALVTAGRPKTGYPALVDRLALLMLGWGYAVVMVAVAGEAIRGPSLSWNAVPFLNPLLSPAILLFLLVKSGRGGEWVGRLRTAEQPALAS